MTGIVDSFAGGAEPTMTHRQREAAMETSMRDEERAREIALGTILCGESLTALAATITASARRVRTKKSRSGKRTSLTV